MLLLHKRGHPIYYDGDIWRYLDTDESVDDGRPCARCGRLPEDGGEDACLGHREGVSSACCGHGVDRPILVLVWEVN